MEDKLGKLKEIIKGVGIEKLIIMLLSGIFLIIVSFPSNKNENIPKESNIIETISSSDYTDEYVAKLENKLKVALSKVENVGNVEVMITLKSSKESVVNKDTPYEKNDVTEEDAQGGTRQSSSMKNEQQTVLIEEDGDNVPFVIKEIEPEIMGVVVVAEGGGNQKVINDITEAVEVLFSVPVHKIKVMKMN